VEYNGPTLHFECNFVNTNNLSRGLLGWDGVDWCDRIPMFRRTIFRETSPYGVTNQKTTAGNFVAVKSSNLAMFKLQHVSYQSIKQESSSHAIPCNIRHRTEALGWLQPVNAQVLPPPPAPDPLCGRWNNFVVITFYLDLLIYHENLNSRSWGGVRWDSALVTIPLLPVSWFAYVSPQTLLTVRNDTES
jgi:hypothetical protein